MAVNPTCPLAPIFQRRAHVPPVRHTTPNISSSQSILPSQCIPESRFLPQSDPTRSLADLQDLDDPDPEDDSNFLEDGVNDDVDDFFPMEESGLEDETSPLVSGRRPPPPFVMRAFKKAMDLIQSCPPGGFYLDCPKSGPGPPGPRSGSRSRCSGPGPRIVGPGPVDVRTGLQVRT